MNTALLTALLVLVLFTESTCQVIGYFLPEKKLRITAVYHLKGYALMSNPGDQQEVLDRRFDLTVTDDIKVEEVIVPDRNRYFEVSLPQQVSKGGAQYDWSVKLNPNGILTGWNGSREPITGAVISGSIGLAANLLTGITGIKGVLPASSETTYKVVTDQKIRVTEIVDIPANGISGKVVAVPRLDTIVTNALTRMPAVSISIADISGSGPVSPDATLNSKEVLYYVAPRHYHLQVSVNENGLVESTNVIDYMLVVPQHGQLKHIALSELFKGRKSAALSIDPTTGQLLTWQYKRGGNSKSEIADINKQLESLNKAISGAVAAQHRKLEQEVERLELEIQKRDLTKELSSE